MRAFLLASAATLGLAGGALAQTTVVTTTTEPVETTDQNAADAAVGGTAGAVVGGLIAGPVGAAVGAAIGAGAAASVEPTPEVRTWIVENPAPSVVYTGDVVVGATIPQDTVLVEVPETTEYRYVRLNEQDVLVDPTTYQIVYVY